MELHVADVGRRSLFRRPVCDLEAFGEPEERFQHPGHAWIHHGGDEHLRLRRLHPKHSVGQHVANHEVLVIFANRYLEVPAVLQLAVVNVRLVGIVAGGADEIRIQGIAVKHHHMQLGAEIPLLQMVVLAVGDPVPIPLWVPGDIPGTRQ